MLSDVILSLHIGREITWHSPHFTPHERTTPHEQTLGLEPLWSTPNTPKAPELEPNSDRALPNWATAAAPLRHVTLWHGRVEEMMVLSPENLFASESDAAIRVRRRTADTTRSGPATTTVAAGKGATASLLLPPLHPAAVPASRWGDSSAAAIVHLVCAAYPGGGIIPSQSDRFRCCLLSPPATPPATHQLLSRHRPAGGGRVTAMALWGRGLTADIQKQLGGYAACASVARGGRRGRRTCLSPLRAGRSSVHSGASPVHGGTKPRDRRSRADRKSVV